MSRKTEYLTCREIVDIEEGLRRQADFFQMFITDGQDKDGYWQKAKDNCLALKKRLNYANVKLEYHTDHELPPLREASI